MNIHLARLFCLIAALTYIFYKDYGLCQPINSRFKASINESIKLVNEGNNIVIFGESNGYLDQLKEFLLVCPFCEIALRRGIDLPIYAAYLREKTNVLCLINQ